MSDAPLSLPPIPPNDFREFVATYFDAVRRRFPRAEAILGKWNEEDLLPGLSDFDARLIFDDAMADRDWLEMSVAVGEAHAELCLARPAWARKLEHTPGINLSWAEVLDRPFYYPEFLQWSFHGGDASRYGAVWGELASRGWSVEDELHHLKRFLAYFGPYQRGIDPPVNLGVFEAKYPLHSRMMHYYLPPLQSGLSLLGRRTIRGKLEALRTARGMLGSLRCVDTVLHALEHHYEVPLYYREPFLGSLEEALHADLRKLFLELRGSITAVEVDRGSDDPAPLRAELKRSRVDLPTQVFTGLRFSRTMKGRLLFYARAIPHFDSGWLIDNELRRMDASFLVQPLRGYLLLRGDEPPPAVEAMVERLRGELFDAAEARAILRFHGEASAPYRESERPERARAVAAAFDDFYLAIGRLVADVRRLATAGGARS